MNQWNRTMLWISTHRVHIIEDHIFRWQQILRHPAIEDRGRNHRLVHQSAYCLLPPPSRSSSRSSPRQGRSLWHPGPGLNRINKILIPTSCNFFSESRSPKNSEVKRAWPGEIWGWVTDREVLPGCARVRTKCAEKTGVGLWGQSMS